jgi:methylase of polypeptide subunit release factors
VQPSSEQVQQGFQFNNGMIGWGNVIEMDTLIHGKCLLKFDSFISLTTAKDFPWNKLPKGTTVCDVGGGVGNISIKLAKHYPTLHLVLQDLPQPLDTAEKKIWPERCPEAISENRIEFIPLDFLKGAPKKGCDIYYVRFNE